MTIEIRCNICGQNVPTDGTRGYHKIHEGLIEEVYVTAGEIHICGGCFSTILSNLPKTPLPYELSDDPKDLAELLQRVENQDHNSFSEDAEYLIARGVRVLRDTSRPDDRPDPGPSGLPPEVAGY